MNHRLGFAYLCPTHVESQPQSYGNMPVVAVGRTCSRGQITIEVSGLVVSEGSPELG